MSTILHSLNGTRKKKRTLAPSESAQAQQPKVKMSHSQAIKTRKSNLGAIRPLQEAAEYEEISNI